MEAWHRFLDHTSEVELQVGAEDLSELLREAGEALGEMILRGSPAEVEEDERTIRVTSHDREALLVDWLNEIIYLADVEGWVPAEIEVTEASPTCVVARGLGASLPAAGSAVKAATFHGLHIRDLPGGLEAEVILDV